MCSLLKVIFKIINGITKFLIFPVPSAKSEIKFDFSFVIKTILAIKARFGNNVWIAADTCLCAYTSHGHCGCDTPSRACSRSRSYPSRRVSPHAPDCR